MGTHVMDARYRRILEAVTQMGARVEVLASRLKRTEAAAGAWERTLRMRRLDAALAQLDGAAGGRRVSGVSGVPRPRAGPRAGVASSCSKVPFRGEVARADAQGRLRVHGASSRTKVPFRGEIARADATGRLRRVGR